MYIVYILQSINFGKYYIGHTNNLRDRVNRHNRGDSTYSKKFRPWKIVYTENYNDRSRAYRREMEIKSYKGGLKFKKLLGLWKV